MTSEEVIKEKMEELANRWKGKGLAPGSVDEIRKKIDRMIYRNLKRTLEKLQKKTGSTDIVKEAKRIFEVE